MHVRFNTLETQAQGWQCGWSPLCGAFSPGCSTAPQGSFNTYSCLLSVYGEKNDGGVWVLSHYLCFDQSLKATAAAAQHYTDIRLRLFLVTSLYGLRRLLSLLGSRAFLSWYCLFSFFCSFLIDVSPKYKLFLSLNERLLAAFSDKSGKLRPS